MNLIIQESKAIYHIVGEKGLNYNLNIKQMGRVFWICMTSKNKIEKITCKKAYLVQTEEEAEKEFITFSYAVEKVSSNMSEPLSLKEARVLAGISRIDMAAIIGVSLKRWIAIETLTAKQPMTAEEAIRFSEATDYSLTGYPEVLYLENSTAHRK
ncbi:helix-turn-helix transcriptional regulator [Domibacillus sp. PGB-M46]|uniref:helix-turn-helix domain-containing protein n=1 Tax=Domibacillus sp. PGB-M46 TaxID=2910255 RepID=UPI001F569679|nr:helix-turn-helix transcriptional regulator [Domibacillus sp. PGB-M46]MCI2255539.1 helix-turn-helix transcriptional regulator [Domibacillus sp. PGB-M46]